ncbi:MAG TPA: insulinase family protein, partial [Chitinophaga sp.]
QRKVVIEEFKEHYINKPYGDVWAKMRELAYTTHPYRWLTIGRELSHIENAQLEDVKAFFFKHYTPVNAILVVGGKVTLAQVKELTQKWFGDIPSGEKYVRNLPQEPAQTAARKLEVRARVPLDALYKCFPMYPRSDRRYYAADLVSDILGGGSSSRLHQVLVKEKKLFSNIECYHFGSLDAGLLTIEGKLVKGVKMEAADAAINEEIRKLQAEEISERELQKVKNRVESMLAFEDISLLNRANNLAFYELMGDAAMMNTEFANYERVTAREVHAETLALLDEKKSNTLYYYADHQ